jgi:hypothetical protein
MSTDKPATATPPKKQSNVSYAHTEKDGVTTITRSDGKTNTTLATLKDEKLTYPNAESRKLYHTHVARYLNEEDIPFNADDVSIEGSDDDENDVDMSKAPRRTIEQGDKTPAYVEWLKKNKPKLFEKTYGVRGEGTVVRRLKGTDPVTGRPTERTFEERALISDRKTHLTEKPDAETLANDTGDEA